jgi:hypothetical protein
MVNTASDGGGGGGGEMGISPSELQSMINTMKSSTSSALNLVNNYLGEFSQIGLDASSLKKAAQDLQWAQGQVPMLSRRQSMAQAVANQHPGLTVTTAGAGQLDFPTNAAASAAGQKAGKQAMQTLLEHDNNDQFILSELQKYGNDPAYLASFFQALGPQGLAQLGLQVTGYQQSGNKSQYQQWASTVGNAFATATYSMPYSNNFLSNMHLPDDPGADAADPQLSLIAPFLENGVYSPTWLKPLGSYALQQAYMAGQMPGTNVMPGNLDPIWTAISHNPSFAAQYYNQNFNNSQNPRDSLSGIMGNPGNRGFNDSAFAGMIQAATIAPQGTTNITPWSNNAQLTVQTFGKDTSASLSSSEQAVFGLIAMNYFNSVADSVRAAAPYVGKNGSIPGWQITASESDWGNFIEQAMQDKATSAQIMAFYGAWYAKNYPQDDRGPGQAQVPGEQGFWNNASLGLLTDFMAHNYQVAGAPAGNDSSDILKEVASAGGAAFLTSLAFGPEAGLATALVEGGKDAFQTAAEQGIQHAWPDSVQSSPNGDEALSQLTGVQTQWAQTVNWWYNGSPGNPQPPPTITPVSYMGQTWTGDPNYYENKYGGTFINKSGQVEDPSQIANNPKALAAYNAWLQDPAIVYHNESSFSTRGLGELLSQYARSNSGGG